ncbi:MAG: hypothetical protein BECKG1743F_GA0114225_103381, partial [Candidatus Kentron sp. G]
PLRFNPLFLDTAQRIDNRRGAETQREEKKKFVHVFGGNAPRPYFSNVTLHTCGPPSFPATVMGTASPDVLCRWLWRCV